MAWKQRRRRIKGENLPPLKPFDAAFAAIDLMERRVAKRTITVDFTVEDLVRTLWPQHVVGVLRAAFQYIRDYDKSNVNNDSFAFMGARVLFDLHVKDTHMCAPEYGLVEMQDTEALGRIEETLREYVALHQKFSVVRHVVSWFNDNATLGATKYYFPSIVPLLPVDHAIHKVDGQCYREPKRPVGEIAPAARDAMTTIAMGLLTNDADIPTATNAKFAIRLTAGTGGSSQNFVLI